MCAQGRPVVHTKERGGSVWLLVRGPSWDQNKEASEKKVSFGSVGRLSPALFPHQGKGRGPLLAVAETACFPSARVCVCVLCVRTASPLPSHRPCRPIAASRIGGPTTKSHRKERNAHALFVALFFCPLPFSPSVSPPPPTRRPTQRARSDTTRPSATSPPLYKRTQPPPLCSLQPSLSRARNPLASGKGARVCTDSHRPRGGTLLLLLLLVKGHHRQRTAYSHGTCRPAAGAVP